MFLSVVLLFCGSACAAQAAVTGVPQDETSVAFIVGEGTPSVPVSGEEIVDSAESVPTALLEDTKATEDIDRASRHLGFGLGFSSYGQGGYGFYAPNYEHHHHSHGGYGHGGYGGEFGHGGYGHGHGSYGHGHGGYGSQFGQGGYGHGHGGYGGDFGHGGYGHGGYGHGGYGHGEYGHGGYGHGGYGHGGFGGYEPHHHHQGFGRGFLQEYAPIYPTQQYPSKILYGIEPQTPLLFNSFPQGVAPTSHLVLTPPEPIPPLAPQDISQQNVVVPPVVPQEIKPIAPEVPGMNVKDKQSVPEDEEQECVCKKKNKQQQADNSNTPSKESTAKETLRRH